MQSHPPPAPSWGEGGAPPALSARQGRNGVQPPQRRRALTHLGRTRFSFSVSSRFPRADRPSLLARLKRHNSSRSSPGAELPGEQPGPSCSVEAAASSFSRTAWVVSANGDRPPVREKVSDRCSPVPGSRTGLRAVRPPSRPSKRRAAGKAGSGRRSRCQRSRVSGTRPCGAWRSSGQRLQADRRPPTPPRRHSVTTSTSEME